MRSTILHNEEANGREFCLEDADLELAETSPKPTLLVLHQLSLHCPRSCEECCQYVFFASPANSTQSASQFPRALISCSGRKRRLYILASFLISPSDFLIAPLHMCLTFHHRGNILYCKFLHPLRGYGLGSKLT